MDYDKSAPPAYPHPQQNPYQPQPNPYQPQPGGYNPQPSNYYPQPGQPQVIVQNPPMVVVGGVGNCPSCQRGILVDDYGCCAIFLAIFFFPIGVLCCLAMKERACNNCGQRF